MTVWGKTISYTPACPWLVVTPRLPLIFNPSLLTSAQSAPDPAGPEGLPVPWRRWRRWHLEARCRRCRPSARRTRVAGRTGRTGRSRVALRPWLARVAGRAGCTGRTGVTLRAIGTGLPGWSGVTRRTGRAVGAGVALGSGRSLRACRPWRSGLAALVPAHLLFERRAVAEQVRRGQRGIDQPDRPDALQHASRVDVAAVRDRRVGDPACDCEPGHDNHRKPPTTRPKSPVISPPSSIRRRLPRRALHPAQGQVNGIARARSALALRTVYGPLTVGRPRSETVRLDRNGQGATRCEPSEHRGLRAWWHLRRRCSP